MAYAPTTWLTGDIITAAKLNNMEAGIAAAVLRSGDTMTGTLGAPGYIVKDPTDPNKQMLIQYVAATDKYKVIAVHQAVAYKPLVLVGSDIKFALNDGAETTIYHAGNLVPTACGTYTDTTTSIPASSTININIPVGSGKAKARLHMLGVYGGIVDCSTVGADTVGTFINTTVTATFLRSVSGYVFDTGVIGTDIKLLDAYISGTNLVLVCQNVSAADPRVLNIRKLHWQAF